jgi:hypothetical protein
LSAAFVGVGQDGQCLGAQGAEAVALAQFGRFAQQCEGRCRGAGGQVGAHGHGDRQPADRVGGRCADRSVELGGRDDAGLVDPAQVEESVHQPQRHASTCLAVVRGRAVQGAEQVGALLGGVHGGPRVAASALFAGGDRTQQRAQHEPVVRVELAVLVVEAVGFGQGVVEYGRVYGSGEAAGQLDQGVGAHGWADARCREHRAQHRGTDQWHAGRSGAAGQFDAQHGAGRAVRVAFGEADRVDRAVDHVQPVTQAAGRDDHGRLGPQPVGAVPGRFDRRAGPFGEHQCQFGCPPP